MKGQVYVVRMSTSIPQKSVAIKMSNASIPRRKNPLFRRVEAGPIITGPGKLLCLHSGSCFQYFCR